LQGLVRIAAALAVLTIFACCPCDAFSQARAAEEYAIKAAFLYKLTIYIEWPEESFADETTPITIAIVGEDPFRSLIDKAIEGKTVQGRTFAVKRFSLDDLLSEDIKEEKQAELRACQIVFVPQTAQKTYEGILERVAVTGVLVIGEGEDFAELGGIMSLVLTGRKVGFEVNLAAAERSNIKISSIFFTKSLYKLANLYLNISICTFLNKFLISCSYKSFPNFIIKSTSISLSRSFIISLLKFLFNFFEILTLSRNINC